MARPARTTLAAFAEDLRAQGRYDFDRDEALAALRVSPAALKLAAHRLSRRGMLVAPRRGFYVIVPPEHRHAGAPPPSTYVDDLMRFQGQPYYVALVSAAALHGAAHHAPQEFQVMTSAPLRPIEVGRSTIRFFVRHDVADVPVTVVKTDTGTMRVGTPEATVIDLVRYPHASGQAAVPSLLAALAPKLRSSELVRLATTAEPRHVQRLGALLDRVGGRAKTAGLARLVDRLDLPDVALRADRPLAGARRDRKWRVVVNDVVEVDS